MSVPNFKYKALIGEAKEEKCLGTEDQLLASCLNNAVLSVQPYLRINDSYKLFSRINIVRIDDSFHNCLITNTD